MPDTPLGRVVVAGGSGLIGSALVEALRADGVDVIRLVRREPRAPGEVTWLQDATPLDPGVLDGADAVVCMNGASIGRFPWTAGYKSTLLWSRITPTRTLATALRALGTDAPAFVASSAVGYYGARPLGRVDETAPPGDGFLAELCVEWEAAARAAGPHMPVARVRTAPVVHPRGVLAPLMLLTRLGLAGPIGRGTQVWPWISLDDEIAALRHVLHRRLDGAVNLTGPVRATANDLGFALARRMNRPYLLRVPAPALRLVLGRDATEALLTTDAEVTPAVLERGGFTFSHRTVEDAVAAVVPAAG